MRDDPLFYLMLVAVAVVAGILLLGIGSFGRGGAFNARNANRIMRWRIGAQFVAVMVILGVVWLRQRGAP